MDKLFFSKLWSFLQRVCNRYIVTIIFFAFLLFFFLDDTYIDRIEYQTQIKELKGKIAESKEHISKLKDQAAALRSDDEKLERFARERYYMKRANEDIFIVEE